MYYHSSDKLGWTRFWTRSLPLTSRFPIPSDLSHQFFHVELGKWAQHCWRKHANTDELIFTHDRLFIRLLKLSKLMNVKNFNQNFGPCSLPVNVLHQGEKSHVRPRIVNFSLARDFDQIADQVADDLKLPSRHVQKCSQAQMFMNANQKHWYFATRHMSPNVNLIAKIPFYWIMWEDGNVIILPKKTYPAA